MAGRTASGSAEPHHGGEVLDEHLVLLRGVDAADDGREVQRLAAGVAAADDDADLFWGCCEAVGLRGAGLVAVAIGPQRLRKQSGSRCSAAKQRRDPPTARSADPLVPSASHHVACRERLIRVLREVVCHCQLACRGQVAEQVAGPLAHGACRRIGSPC